MLKHASDRSALITVAIETTVELEIYPAGVICYPKVDRVFHRCRDFDGEKRPKV